VDRWLAERRVNSPSWSCPWPVPSAPKCSTALPRPADRLRLRHVFPVWYRETYLSCGLPTAACISRLREWEVRYLLLNRDAVEEGTDLEEVLDPRPTWIGLSGSTTSSSIASSCRAARSTARAQPQDPGQVAYSPFDRSSSTTRSRTTAASPCSSTARTPRPRMQQCHLVVSAAKPASGAVMSLATTRDSPLASSWLGRSAGPDFPRRSRPPPGAGAAPPLIHDPGEQVYRGFQLELRRPRRACASALRRAGRKSATAADINSTSAWTAAGAALRPSGLRSDGITCADRKR
jgi:hypothetical protein